MAFTITGSMNMYSNRNTLEADIEKHDGNIASGVDAKNDYLINNEMESQSSKNCEAKELGIPILTEDGFKKMLGE